MNQRKRGRDSEDYPISHRNPDDRAETDSKLLLTIPEVARCNRRGTLDSGPEMEAVSPSPNWIFFHCQGNNVWHL